MSLLTRIIIGPLTYVSWTGFVVTALIATYFVDPYVFGFSILILGGASLAVMMVGIVVLITVKPLPARTRVMIALALTLVAAALATALVTVRSFNWA